MFNNNIFIIILCFFILETRCLTFVEREKYNESLQVKTNKGLVQGFQRRTSNGKDMFIYRSIPFAIPPLNNLRFTSPQEHTNWSGILNATMQPPSCIEFTFKIPDISITGSEDCLYLNVYSPVKPSVNETVPVLFWIYGGAFQEGNTTLYDPEYLVEENLVVVTVNYRIGIFGFLSTQDKASPGNYGLKDQNAALKWVQKNIKNFGGDPNRVTIMGQSAGACSAMYHMISSKSKGLFHGVIAMSGDTLAPWCFQKNPRKIANDISLHMGLSMENTTNFIEELRQISSTELSYGQIIPIVVNTLNIYHSGLAFTPVVEYDHEDAFITGLSYTLLKNGQFTKVPLIIGTTSLEFNSFSKALTFIRPLLLLLDLSPSMVPPGMNIPSFSERRLAGKKILKQYFQSESIMSATDEELLHFLSDVLYIKSTQKSIQLLTKYIPVYMYVFDYQGEISLDLLDTSDHHASRLVKGIGHMEDVTYIWKKFSLNEQDKLISRRIVKIWSNFVKYGDPTPVTDVLLQNITWPRIHPSGISGSMNYLHITENLTIRQNYRSSYTKFWAKLFEEFVQEPFYTY